MQVFNGRKIPIRYSCSTAVVTVNFLVLDVFLEFLFLHELASEDLCTFFVNSSFVIYPVVNPKIACLHDVFFHFK